MTTRLSTAIKNARLTVVTNALDAGPSYGTIELYTSPRIAAIGDTPTGTLLCTLQLNEPCANVAGGVATFTIPPEAVCVAGGTATWALWKDGSGAQVMDTDVGNLASTAEVRISNPTLTLGTTVEIILGSMT